MKNASVAQLLRNNWQRLSRLPGGKWLFSKLLGFMVPYTGALGATVQELKPGHCIVTLKERRGIRNHLRCVHAIALANLCEVSSGLAVLSGMPDTARGILTGIDVTYLKKARGTLTASCTCNIPETNEKKEVEIFAQIHDTNGEIVTTAKARWLIGPIIQ